ncbi:acyl-CoA N-acyltransferase [Hyaloraphidium curvatum]|nr:acyl-CoA N-acyltransferase [Hyaloraphidium curvatum]
MMASTESLNLQKWLSDSNEVFNLRLVSADDDPEDRSACFRPEFTWLLFEEEKIFGYRDPKIDLFFAAGSLRPYFSFTYGSRIPNTSAAEFEPTDVKAAVDEKLTIKDDYATDMDEFMKGVREDEESFEPTKLGATAEKLHEYTRERKGEPGEPRTFEIYKFDFDSRKFRAYHRRLQTFLPLFIDGARFIDDTDERWEIYVTFERRPRPTGRPSYSAVAYATCYPFFYYHPTPDKKRMRISQFLVLPPHQKSGHGAALYRALMASFVSRPEVAEVTVEDPNDSFTDVRDVADLRMLVDKGAFAAWERGKLPTAEQAAELGKQGKLSARQARRMAEVWALKLTNPKDAGQVKAYRLWVKGRIYRQNKDVLATMTLQERRQKVHEAYEGLVEQDYRNILFHL